MARCWTESYSNNSADLKVTIERKCFKVLQEQNLKNWIRKRFVQRRNKVMYIIAWYSVAGQWCSAVSHRVHYSPCVPARHWCHHSTFETSSHPERWSWEIRPCPFHTGCWTLATTGRRPGTHNTLLVVVVSTPMLGRLVSCGPQFIMLIGSVDHNS